MLLMIDQPQGRFLASHAGPKSSVLLGSLALDVSPKPLSSRKKAGIKAGIGLSHFHGQSTRLTAPCKQHCIH